MEEKKLRGRKHHIVTDIMGNLLGVLVHAANIHDAMAGANVVQVVLEKYPPIIGFCADA